MRTSPWIPTVGSSALIALQVSFAQAAITETQLAGNSLTSYPFFEYVRAFNMNAPVKVAIDPTRFPSIVGHTCNILVVAHKSAAQWAGDPSLTDVTPGGAQTQSFGGTTIQNNTFQVTGQSELNANAGTGLGIGYDVVLDCDQNGQLSDGDFIDGRGDEAGFYVVSDTTAGGPLAVTEQIYNLDSGVAGGFGIPPFKLGEDLYFPTDIGTMGQLPIIIISRGNGHNFQWYDHIGLHMASYGYIVMSHDNNTEPGPLSAATTTLGHTDAFIDQAQAGAIAGGALVGHLDTSRITWIGHSRGAEGVAIAYDRLFDGAVSATHFARGNIKLISSMLPTDFEGTDISNPHDANYHLWTASGDDDVDGSAGCDLCQTFHLHDRATGYRQSTVVQGTGHAWFHDGPETPDAFDGPCSIGPTNDLTHRIQLGYFLPLIKHYVEGNIPALDFLTRQYESFHPIGVPNGNPCIVVTNEYRNGSPCGNFIIDDYQTQTNSGISSSGGQVNFDVEHLTEGRLDDNNDDFTWNAADPFNGATQASATDSSRGVVFDWTNQDKFYEWEIIPGQRDFRDNLYLSFRAAQGTQHPNTLAAPGDLTFSVTLRDIAGTTSSINIGAYGGGLEQPYARNGGWHNEMETIHIRTTDFLHNGSGLNLSDIVAVRLNVGPTWGSSRGRIVVDQVMLTNDLPPGAPDAPPEITCPADITQNTDPGLCSAVVTFAATATDDCGAVNVSCTPASGSVFPKGTTTVTCAATDSANQKDTCDFDVTVNDTEPPKINCSAANSSLWPPNHKMVNVGLTVAASDNCSGPLPIGVQVFSDEGDTAPTGEGNFSPDAKDIAPGTLRLRSERDGGADGRVYLIVTTGTDTSGNVTSDCCTVVVTHDQSKASIASVNAQATSAHAFCAAHNGAPPPGFVQVGGGPVIGPHQ
jgi:HYR domain